MKYLISGIITVSGLISYNVIIKMSKSPEILSNIKKTLEKNLKHDK